MNHTTPNPYTLPSAHRPNRGPVAGSIFALLDDIAVLAKAAAASVDDVAVGAAHASAKAAGVVIDDAAVTPQYVRGITPARELPVVWRITKGSLRNKAVIIALILALSVWAPWVFPWLLIAGGSYLAFEGAEKVAHAIAARRRPHPKPGTSRRAPPPTRTRSSPAHCAPTSCSPRRSCSSRWPRSTPTTG